MKLLRVMLVDDHNLVRAGFRALLGHISGVEIVAEAENGRSALELACSLKPDVVLMDIALPDINGLEVATQIMAACPGIRVMLLSMYDNEEYVLEALRINAAGYLLKDAGPAELELALSAVANGEAYLSPAISRRVIDGYARRVKFTAPSTHPEDGTTVTLTGRQSEVLKLIAEGLTTKEIAQRLELSVKTIETHRTQLMKELDIHDIAGLVRYAIRIGLVSAK